MLSFYSCEKDNVYIQDIDGNNYSFTSIGKQIWMSDNLKTTRYNDGETIPLVTDENIWFNLTTPGYFWLDNNETINKDLYGACYNWYAANTGKICPIGWHVPSDEDWVTLINRLGGPTSAGEKLKKIWNIGIDEFWWSSTEVPGTPYVWARILWMNQKEITEVLTDKSGGFSVRCIKD